MTDIVERLLNRATHAMIIKDKPNLYYDAAHEIEHLREENENLRKQSELLAKLHARLLTENADLRDALIDAAAELQHAYIMGFTERHRDAARAARDAVAAIRESGDE